MSAFLGPIHRKMYERIHILEEISSNLILLSKSDELSQHLNIKYGVLDKAPLEEVIDQNNIHGWLDNRVTKAEERYADAVVYLVEENEGNLTNLIAVANTVGKAWAVPNSENALELYKGIDTHLLDGMPCAGGRKIKNSDETTLVFEYDMNLHALCHKDKGYRLFSVLREAFIEGLLSNTTFRLLPQGSGSYKLTKEDQHEHH